jgi:hypothetical protein
VQLGVLEPGIEGPGHQLRGAVGLQFGHRQDVGALAAAQVLVQEHLAEPLQLLLQGVRVGAEVVVEALVGLVGPPVDAVVEQVLDVPEAEQGLAAGLAAPAG